MNNRFNKNIFLVGTDEEIQNFFNAIPDSAFKRRARRLANIIPKQNSLPTTQWNNPYRIQMDLACDTFNIHFNQNLFKQNENDGQSFSLDLQMSADIYDAFFYCNSNHASIMKFEDIRRKYASKTCIAINMEKNNLAPLACLESVSTLQNHIDKHFNIKEALFLTAHHADTNSVFHTIPKDIAMEIYKNQITSSNKCMFFTLPAKKKVEIQPQKKEEEKRCVM